MRSFRSHRSAPVGTNTRPGRCANRRRSEQNQPSKRCDADLAAQAFIGLPLRHPSSPPNTSSAASLTRTRPPSACTPATRAQRMRHSSTSDTLRGCSCRSEAATCCGANRSATGEDLPWRPGFHQYGGYRRIADPGDETARSTGIAIAVAIACCSPQTSPLRGRRCIG